MPGLMISQPISWHLRGGMVRVGGARRQALHLLRPRHRQALHLLQPRLVIVQPESLQLQVSSFSWKISSWT